MNQPQQSAGAAPLRPHTRPLSQFLQEPSGLTGDAFPPERPASPLPGTSQTPAPVVTDNKLSEFIVHPGMAVEPAAAEPPAALVTSHQSPAARPAAAAFGFEPALEVDHVVWPKVCDRLYSAAAGELDRLAESVARSEPGKGRVVAVGACHRGQGATTLLLCAAQRLVQQGKRVLIIDADMEEARLGHRLGLLPEAGWEEVLAGQLPLEEAAIQSVRQPLTILALRRPFVCTAIAWRRFAESLQTLRPHYDTILVNLGPLSHTRTAMDLLAQAVGRQVDLLLVVRDLRHAPAGPVDDACRKLAAAGIAEVAIVENFVRDPRCRGT